MEYSVDVINQELKGWDGGKYYGQWETDRIIESYFDDGYKGTCIEVGAANGIKGSNTLYFEERGWSTLCIEPNTEHKKSLEKHRKLVRYYACSNNKGVLPLTVYKVGEKNIMSSLTSLKPDDRLVEAHKDIINEKFIIDVRVETLPWILENAVSGTPFEGGVNIDFISIDTEGTELDVLKGFDFNRYDVKLFVVENNYDDPEIKSFMNTKGFIRDKRYKINDFYIKKNKKNIMNFIQIGANIGASENDVIWNLMEEKKWKGVLVEPVPESFNRLVENYKSIEGCFFEQSAIADYDGEITIYSRSDYKNKSQQASINKNHWSNDKSNKVNCLKLESLVSKYGLLNKEFDLLQIDAEGADDLILLNCDFNKVKPKEIRFESVHLGKGRLKKVLDYLKIFGYEKTKDIYLKYVKAFPGYEHYDIMVKKIK